MATYRVQSDQVALGVTSVGGHLDDVTFRLDEATFAPLHTSPWANEEHDASIPPMLRTLRGDFFCAPFGASDVEPDETRPHGATANADWELTGRDVHELRLQLTKKVCGATVEKLVSVRPGHAAIYQQHRFSGGRGELPMGHHLMVKATSELRLGFSPYVWSGTPPVALEPDPSRGRSLLAYPQQFKDLRAVRRADGTLADVTRYPWESEHDDICMLVTDQRRYFGWTTATNADSGWVLFALKLTAQLAGTVIWMSNGGRHYAPWNSRHQRVIGLEETTSYFHHGHAASLGKNEVKAAGYPTTVTLNPQQPTEVRYVFGLAACPHNFGRVIRVDPAPGGIRLHDESGQTVSANVDLSFLTASPQ